MPARAFSNSAEKCAVDPNPAIAMVSLPGFFFANAMNSGNVFAGIEGCTAMSCELDAICPTAAKSLSASYGSFGYTTGYSAMVPVLPRKML